MEKDTGPAPARDRRRFATTRWSLVVAAGGPRSKRSEQALADLCESYWYPLYVYVRRRGYDADSARDLTQAFFAKLLEKQNLKVADPSRGRFRTFLLGSLKNFLAGEWRRRQAEKRGSGQEPLSLDFAGAEERYRVEPSHRLGPEEIYQRRWALALLERVAEELQRQYAREGKATIFEALKGYVSSAEEALPYAALAARLGQSEGSLRTAASRLRGRWRSLLRDAIAETVNDESEIKDELRSLLAAVAEPANEP